MGANQLHRHELSFAFTLLLILLSFRIDRAVKNWRTKAKGSAQVDFYKNAHQAELVKEWVTSQYCKADLDILCPPEVSPASCSAAFDPPLRFVLELKDDTTDNCSIRELIDHTQWTDRADAKDLEEEELLTYFIAHILDQVRTKSSLLFRGEDRSILEFEQSRLIESTLASLLDLLASPTKVSKEGQAIATTATEYKITGRKVYTKGEITGIMHEAVLWHTHHKRHGSSSAGAALRLSRQQPSFLFKFLPLVKEQIQNLELDDSLESKYRKLYPLQSLSSEAIPLNLDRPKADQCLWSHYEQGSLISQDCMLALETAPLKIRDLDWEGNFSLVLIYIYTFLSGAFVLWNLSRARRRQDDHKNYEGHCGPEVMEIPAFSTKSLDALSNRSLKAASSRSLQPVVVDEANAEIRERKNAPIRVAKWALLTYLISSILLALVSSWAAEAIQFSDFLDGMCLIMLGFLSLGFVPVDNQRVQVDDKRKALLDPSRNRHYKKFASVEFLEPYEPCTKC